MLTQKILASKRRRKEIKRQTKREKLTKHRIVEKAYAKRAALKRKAMQILLKNPDLLKKFIESQTPKDDISKIESPKV